ncbi:alpha/beta hydrolase [Thalassotalea profundi]|uniref:Esterase n=1 Tax=Thalassotalea profundi TaxID=2036687 RepID=A0ABQ3IHX0_9GAMM|nr:alpha/beta hydrolase-fold protein [Thalassotalea profundi]GHE84252.1 esterase [Thalassotalea profundi]
MRLILAFYLLCCLLTNANALTITNTNNFTSSELSIGEKVEFHSTILNEKRVLNIYLPESYKKNSTKQYPVIYLLDGSIEEDFIHIAGLVQFNSFSWINNIPETIVVGIANIDRKRDFTFKSTNSIDLKELPTSGGSAYFIQFIANELQPLIDSNYRTNKTKTLIGQSLGGLLATEILFKTPYLFDHYIIISPSLWWNDESLLKVTPKYLKAPQSVYIGVGKEGDVMERVAESLYQKVNKSSPTSTKIFFNYFEKLSHGDTLHLAIYDAFEKIFKKTKS